MNVTRKEFAAGLVAAVTVTKGMAERAGGKAVAPLWGERL